MFKKNPDARQLEPIRAERNSARFVAHTARLVADRARDSARPVTTARVVVRADEAVLSRDAALLVAVIVPFIINIYGATAPVQAASKHDSATGWKVEQVCQSEGQLWLLMTDTALKLTIPKQNLVIVARAPSWNVVTVNKKENLGKQMTRDLFVIGGFRIFGKEKGSVIESRSRAQWQGQPAELIVTRLSDSDPLKEKLEMLYQDSEARYAEVKTEKYLFEKWMNLRFELRHLLSGLYRVDSSNGLLLQRTSVYQNGKNHLLLKTISVTRAPIDLAQFEYPKGFKPVVKTREVTMERRKREQAAGVLEDMFMDR